MLGRFFSLVLNLMAFLCCLLERLSAVDDASDLLENITLEIASNMEQRVALVPAERWRTEGLGSACNAQAIHYTLHADLCPVTNTTLVDSGLLPMVQQRDRSVAHWSSLCPQNARQILDFLILGISRKFADIIDLSSPREGMDRTRTLMAMSIPGHLSEK
jgi:hypothetical protein